MKALQIIAVCALVFVCAAARADVAYYRVKITEGTKLNLRAEPSTQARALGQIGNRQCLIGLGETKQQDGRTWLKVKMPGGTPGWVAKDFIEAGPACGSASASMPELPLEAAPETATATGTVATPPAAATAAIKPPPQPVSETPLVAPKQPAPPVETPRPAGDARCPEGMAYIPAGDFVMGADKSEIDSVLEICLKSLGDPCNRKDWLTNESPAATVSANAFCMDRTEVMQGAYEPVMGRNPSQYRDCGPDCPVEHVDWFHARSYCLSVGKRLPTEAEWEKAARGGKTTRFFWGDEPDGRFLWYDDNSGRVIHRVAGTQPNTYGLYDVLGNVWEWVQDCYLETWYGEMPKSNPVNARAGCDYRVLRGGGWYSELWDTRLSRRWRFYPDNGAAGSGFRCAADPTGAQPQTQMPPPPVPEPELTLKYCFEKRRALDKEYYTLYREFLAFARDVKKNPADYIGKPGGAIDNILAHARDLQTRYEDFVCPTSQDRRFFDYTLMLMRDQTVQLASAAADFQEYLNTEDQGLLRAASITMNTIYADNANVLDVWAAEEKAFSFEPIAGGK